MGRIDFQPLCRNIFLTFIYCFMFAGDFSWATGTRIGQHNFTNDQFTEGFVKQLSQLIGTNANNGTVSQQQLDNFIVQNSQKDVKSDIESCYLNSSLDCITNQCVSATELLSLYAVRNSTQIDLEELSPALLYRILNPDCQQKPTEYVHRTKPTPAEAWGYGFLFVTIINICALAGAFILPCMNTSFYKIMLIFMVALAVGTLCGSGIIFLIPEAFGLAAEGGTDYVWRALAVVGGVYLFFIIERILKIIMNAKDKENTSTHDMRNEVANHDIDIICSIQTKTPVDKNAKLRDPTALQLSSSTCSTAQILQDSESVNSLDGVSNCDMKGNGYAIHNQGSKKKPIATFAWMIVFGDAFHNFIDGLSIGAAFTESVMAGVSVSVAVICEELPHELGDLAILLNAGMSLKKALCYNFMSACSCYLGFIVGALLGSNTDSHDWVFAIAGGMFLYISLVDMVPEMNSAAELEENRKQIGTANIFIIQNIGMLSGFCVMVLMALYGDRLDFS